jgi:hypothetical protein
MGAQTSTDAFLDGFVCAHAGDVTRRTVIANTNLFMGPSQNARRVAITENRFELNLGKYVFYFSAKSRLLDLERLSLIWPGDPALGFLCIWQRRGPAFLFRWDARAHELQHRHGKPLFGQALFDESELNLRHDWQHYTAGRAWRPCWIPSVSLIAAPVDAAALLWEQRQTHIEALARITRAFGEAYDRLPEWARCGERFIELTSGAPSPAKTRLLQERDRLFSELGLDSFDDLIVAECNAIMATEDAIDDLAPSPNRTAALIMVRLSQDCDKDSYASGNGYCGIMAVAIIALEAPRPNLSGMIRDHAAFFVANTRTPFSEMPFAAS